MEGGRAIQFLLVVVIAGRRWVSDQETRLKMKFSTHIISYACKCNSFEEEAMKATQIDYRLADSSTW
jgi:hypothetical protein